MCLVVQSEVILANVLSQVDEQSGVDRNELARYCKHLKNELAKLPSMESEYVYFDLDEQSIDNAIDVYQNFFVEFGKRIFISRRINVDYFNSRFDEDIADTLQKSAISFATLCTK